MTADPYKYFRIEAHELIEQMGHVFLDLEKRVPGPEDVPRLLRLAHTLKGAARVVKQREMADVAHAIEDLLVPLRDSRERVGQTVIDQALTMIDSLNAQLGKLALPPVEAQSAAQPRAHVDESLRTVKADVDEMNDLMEGISETHVHLAALRSTSRNINRVRELAELLVAQLRAPKASSHLVHESLLRKSLSIAEEMSNLVNRTERSIVTNIDQVERELKQVRTGAERLRLLPVQAIFTVLERTARDAAQSLGRQVNFRGEGGDVRLDAQVLAILQGALVQIVRNAVAHGVESEEVRRANGKSPEGKITISVARRSSRVIFVCQDDGKGVDLEAVRSAAQKKGIAADAQKIDSSELFGLLLAGGISTSGTISEVSGRGVGLDVVRDAAQKLHGQIRMRTAAGQGTSIEVEVPVSLASLEALVVESAGQTAVIPLDTIVRAIRVQPEDVSHTNEGQTIVIDDKIAPFAPLATALYDSRVEFARSWSALLVRSGANVAAVGVDRFVGIENVILQSLPSSLAVDPVVAGATLDPEGNPRLVLDPEMLVQKVMQRKASTERAATGRLAPILVVDDSMTTRMLEQTILESAGYDVETAVSAEEGLEKVRRQKFSLCLVDVEMPGMDGFEFITHVRADSSLRDVPAILVTSRNSPEDRARGKSVGAHGYIVKGDFDQKELLERIRELTG